MEGLASSKYTFLAKYPQKNLWSANAKCSPCGSEDRPVLAKSSGLDDGDEEDESDDYILGLLWPVEPSIRLVHNSEDSQKSRRVEVFQKPHNNAECSQMGASRTN